MRCYDSMNIFPGDLLEDKLDRRIRETRKRAEVEL